MSNQIRRAGYLALIAFALTSALWAAPMPEHPCPLIVAHRGSSKTAPENTLAAYALAWEQGSHAAEVDVRLTADGEVVCLHDSTLERTTGLDRPITEVMWDEVRELEAGSWKAEEFTGEPIPLLSEVIAITPPERLLFVEIKTGPSSAQAIVDVMKASGLEERLVVISFNEETLDAVHELMPDMPLLWLLGAPKDPETDEPLPIDPENARIALESGFSGINVSFYGIDDTLIETCNELGMELALWTIDDPVRTAPFIEDGICGITTNVPDVMLETFAPLVAGE